MARGRSVRLFLAEGTPTGILTAEIVNWTGHVLAAPRTKLETAMVRPELKKTGVYILYGNPLASDLPEVYVGEGDDISQRLYAHSRDDDKAFWERFVAVTNKDMNLTKAHVKYLEGRMISMLKDARKCVVVNRTEPSYDRLPEADISDMEAFLEEMQLVLPVIGVDFFRKIRAEPVKQAEGRVAEDPYFVLRHGAKGIEARAREVDGEFVVLAESKGNLNESVSFNDKLKALRQQLLETGRAIKAGASTFELIEDVAFSSPSAASVVLFGTSRNGRTDWTLEGRGLSYGEWKNSLLKSEVD